MVFANTPVGLVSCFLRILKSAFFGLWVLPRLDMSTMPRAFEQFDSGKLNNARGVNGNESKTVATMGHVRSNVLMLLLVIICY
jgi:hypothetical protein